MKKPMWIALSPRGAIKATWYPGCEQKFDKWHNAITALGWTAEPATVTFKRPN